jgi:hypothetical protein
VVVLSIHPSRHPSRHPSSSSLDEEDDGTGRRRRLMAAAAVYPIVFVWPATGTSRSCRRGETSSLRFFFASRKVNFVGFLFHVLQIGSCSAYQWRSHGGGMSRFLFSSSSSAGWVASASWCITGKSRAQGALVDSLFTHAMMFYLGHWHQP